MDTTLNPKPGGSRNQVSIRFKSVIEPGGKGSGCVGIGLCCLAEGQV
eukprot:CAMPEP_0184297678 /NCGR_PEP_ID=MMETSP1049-20130417/8570_1 /TAXON_ID=77928 /ORGANISM="Proteomonas sulcata, Strain CCMP704" /LENGTH=46 /DNA_ID= /DNA_START= /DNA_END= /DNA_ORIENTATION=